MLAHQNPTVCPPAGVPSSGGVADSCPHSRCGFPSLSGVLVVQGSQYPPMAVLCGPLLPGAARCGSRLAVVPGLLAGMSCCCIAEDAMVTLGKCHPPCALRCTGPITSALTPFSERKYHMGPEFRRIWRPGVVPVWHEREGTRLRRNWRWQVWPLSMRLPRHWKLQFGGPRCRWPQ